MHYSSRAALNCLLLFSGKGGPARDTAASHCPWQENGGSSAATLLQGRPSGWGCHSATSLPGLESCGWLRHSLLGSSEDKAPSSPAYFRCSPACSLLGDLRPEIISQACGSALYFWFCRFSCSPAPRFWDVASSRGFRSVLCCCAINSALEG